MRYLSLFELRWAKKTDSFIPGTLTIMIVGFDEIKKGSH